METIDNREKERERGPSHPRRKIIAEVLAGSPSDRLYSKPPTCTRKYNFSLIMHATERRLLTTQGEAERVESFLSGSTVSKGSFHRIRISGSTACRDPTFRQFERSFHDSSGKEREIQCLLFSICLELLYVKGENFLSNLILLRTISRKDENYEKDDENFLALISLISFTFPSI